MKVDGSKLKQVREAAGFSQDVLATKAGVGVRTISRLEKGQVSRPHPDTVAVIAQALGVDCNVIAPLPAEADQAFCAASKPCDAHALVVVPFEELFPQVEGGFAEILVCEVMRRLSRPHGFRIASQLQRVTLAQMGVEVPAEQFSAAFALTGKIYPVGDELRIACELHDMERSTLAWSRSWDVDPGQLRGRPDQAARAIVSALEGQHISLGARRAAVRDDSELDARDLVHKSRLWFTAVSQDSLNEALRLNRRAIELRPSYAVAHSSLSVVLLEQGVNNWAEDPAAHFQRAREASDRAVELAPEQAICFENQGLVEFHCGDHAKSVAALRRAVQLADTNLLAWGLLGMTLAWGGGDETLAEADGILERIIAEAPEHPLSFFWPFFRTGSLLRMGKPDMAVRCGRSSVESRTGYGMMWMAYANALGVVGRAAQAQAVLAEGAATNPLMTPAHYQWLLLKAVPDAARIEPNLAGLRRIGALPPFGAMNDDPGNLL